MNKYTFLLILILGLSSVGCSDLIEDPVSQLNPDAFYATVDIETVEGVVGGAYANMVNRAFMSRALGLTLMLRSDMVDIGNPTTAAERIDHDQFSVQANNLLIHNQANPERGFWVRCYQIINSANNAIEQGQFLEIDEDGVKEELLARARFARAFTYYHLVRLFGDIPYLDEGTLSSEAVVFSKTDVDDVYMNIIEDLEYCKLWLKDTQSNRAVPSKAAASAFLASVYLTRERWQDAYDEATEIISNAGVYNLALEPDYRNIFHAINTDFSNEPIFVLDFNGGTGTDQGRDYLAAFTGLYGQATYYASGGWSVLVPAQAVFDDWDDDDYRKEVCFDDEALDIGGNVVPYTNFSSLDNRNADRPHISKYTAMAGDAPLNNTSGRDSQSNYQMMRYAEVLLIAAEAAVETGRNGEAVQYINMVRARARDANGTPSASPADITGTVTWQDVMEERRLELAFEQKRWYDIVRRRMGPEVFGPNGFEKEILGTKNFSEARDYLLPIPDVELINNPNLAPQNEGY